MQLWKEPKYNLITSEESLLEMVGEVKAAIAKNRPVAYDVETTSVESKFATDPYLSWLLGINIATGKEVGYYIPIAHKNKDGSLRPDQLPLEVVINHLKFLEDSCFFLMHNGKFDYKFSWLSGLYLYPNVYDTMLAQQVINGDTTKTSALKKIVKNYIIFPPGKQPQSFDDASDGNAAFTDPAEFVTYAVDDVVYLHYLYEEQKPVVDSLYSKVLYELEFPLMPILAQAEMKGILIDEEYYTKISKPLEKAKKKIEDYFQNVYNINVGSNPQLGELMSNQFADVDLPTTKKGNIKTSKDVLKALGRDAEDGSELEKFTKHVLKYNQITKTLNTYVNKYPLICHKYYKEGEYDHSILRTTFRQIINSGRQSSSPNVQNITRDGGLISVRKGFIARPDRYFIEADWSSAEYRLIAVASGDEVMLKAYREDPLGTDFHRLSAQGLFGKEDVTDQERYKGKTFNFSALYLGTAWTISRTLNCELEEAEEFLNNFKGRYAGYAAWVNNVREQVRTKGYTETFFGRRRYKSDYSALETYYRNKGMYQNRIDEIILEKQTRELLNHIIQGTCADLLKQSMIKITKEFAKREMYNSYLLTTTHDSNVAETDVPDEAAPIVKSSMECTIGGVLMPVDIVVKRNFSKG